MYLAVRNLQARICVLKTSSNKYFHCYLERIHALEGKWNEAASIWMRQIDITNLQFCCKDWVRIVSFSNFLKMLKAYQTEIRYNFIVMTWKITWKFWFSCNITYDYSSVALYVECYCIHYTMQFYIFNHCSHSLRFCQLLVLVRHKLLHPQYFSSKL